MLLLKVSQFYLAKLSANAEMLQLKVLRRKCMKCAGYKM
jgi:hypothetical protein